MTYNFDPDAWRDNQRLILEQQRQRGELDDAELEAALSELERRYEAMLDRLDGTFVIPRG